MATGDANPPSDQNYRFRFAIPATHPCLAGHFPGQPIVPAVVLLDEVIAALQAQAGLPEIRGITNAKFMAPVLPDEWLDVRCIVMADGRRARFSCELESRGSAQTAVHGELVFGSP